MVDFTEIPLELQLREAHRCIQSHLKKGHRYPQFLSPMFLQWFPAIMDNQISIDWDTITGVFNRAPAFPITLIDVEILDYWCAHPSVWEVAPNLQHSWCILAMVHYSLPSGHKGSPAVVYGASFIYILTHQVRTSLSDALDYLRHSKEDCVILVSTPTKLMFSPQPRCTVIKVPHPKREGGPVLLLQNYPHPLSLRCRGPYHFPTLLNTWAPSTWPPSPLLLFPP